MDTFQRAVSVRLSRSGTYPETIAFVSTNCFGDQITEFREERADGSKFVRYTLTIEEGGHKTDVQLIAWYHRERAADQAEFFKSL
jgi:hypothetical protein